MGHPEPIKIVIMKECPKLRRMYGNIGLWSCLREFLYYISEMTNEMTNESALLRAVEQAEVGNYGAQVAHVDQDITQNQQPEDNANNAEG